MASFTKTNLENQIPHEQLHSMNVLRTPKAGKMVGRILIGIAILFLIVLFLPWQQNITGYGSVTALSPSNRPQEIMTTIPGRISQWYVQEGDTVQTGDTIAVLQEVKDKFFDPELIARLEEQLGAKENGRESKQAKIQAYERQLQALYSNRELKLQQVKNKLRQAELKVFTDSTALVNEEVQFEIAQRQLTRQQTLFEQGLVSQTELEKREQAFQKSRAKLVDTENKLLISRNELINAQVEVNAVRADYAEKISKAESDLNAAQAELAETNAEIAKLKNELANMRIRNEQYIIRAPQNGFIQQAVNSGVGEILKEGSAICTIMPMEPNLAVQIFVTGMDRRWIGKGRTARIEFDGYPAIQFPGNEGIRLGTFAGKVTVIDKVNSKGGKFRILVVPAEGEEWPTDMAQGVGAFAWIMLDTVPIGYEIWRQLNGFPPNVVEEASQSESLFNEEAEGK